MTWITENPLPLFGGLLFLAVVAGVLLTQSGKRLFLWPMLVFGVLAFSVLVVESLIETDKEKVESLVRGLAKDCRDNNVDGILNAIIGEGSETRKQVENLMPQCEFTLCTVSQRPQFDYLRESEARIQVPVFVQVRESPYGPGSSKVEIQLDLVKRNGQWKIKDYGWKLPGEADYHY